jgi:hypothetical protein
LEKARGRSREKEIFMFCKKVHIAVYFVKLLVKMYEELEDGHILS